MKQAITYKDIVLSLGKVISIGELSIKQSPNCHGELYLSAVLDNTDDEMAFYDMEDTVTLTYRQQDSEKILFKGIIVESSMRQIGDHMAVKLTAYDATYNLDTVRRTKSFQNISRTNHSVIDEIMKGYAGCLCIPNIPNEKIGQIWFQYQETDWEFLCRFASHYGEQLYADATYKNARFQIGLSQEQIEVNWESYPYRIGKDFKQYAYLAQNGFSDLKADEFLQYVVESYELFTLGSQLSYRGREWFIASLNRTLREGILVCTYTLKQKGAMSVLKEYNDRITGISADGKVIQINRDKVRVRLNIDTSREQGTYWFPFSTMAASSDGSGWYSMPEEGDSIRVYFPTRDEREGYVITKHDSHIPAAVNERDAGTAQKADTPSSFGGGKGGSGTSGVGLSEGNNDESERTQGGVQRDLTNTLGGAAVALVEASEERKKENPMDDPEKRNIFTQDGNIVQLIPSGVFLTAGQARVALYKSGKIVFKGPNGITINAGNQVYVSGANITLEAKNIIKIDHEQGAEINMMKLGMGLKAKEIHEN